MFGIDLNEIFLSILYIIVNLDWESIKDLQQLV